MDAVADRKPHQSCYQQSHGGQRQQHVQGNHDNSGHSHELQDAAESAEEPRRPAAKGDKHQEERVKHPKTTRGWHWHRGLVELVACPLLQERQSTWAPAANDQDSTAA